MRKSLNGKKYHETIKNATIIRVLYIIKRHHHDSYPAVNVCIVIKNSIRCLLSLCTNIDSIHYATAIEIENFNSKYACKYGERLSINWKG